MPLPAQVVEEPLTGLTVPEEGVDAKAGKTNAQHIATSSIILNFKYTGTALFGNSVGIVDTRMRPPLDFWWAGTPLSCVLQKQATTAD
jgi:hypothetical protein